jgi:hypothetical protein
VGIGSHRLGTIGGAGGVERSLRKNGGITDVVLFVLFQIGFVSRVSNREQTFQANRVERTISIPSVWEKRWKCENHRAASFRGESPNVQELHPEKMFNFAHFDKNYAMTEGFCGCFDLRPRLPACDEGMEHARAFLTSTGRR